MQPPRVLTLFPSPLDHGTRQPQRIAPASRSPTPPHAQEPSLRITPASAVKAASVADTANSLGLHDALQYGPRNLAVETSGQSHLQARLENVRARPHLA